MNFFFTNLSPRVKNIVDTRNSGEIPRARSRPASVVGFVNLWNISQSTGSNIRIIRIIRINQSTGPYFYL